MDRRQFLKSVSAGAVLAALPPAALAATVPALDVAAAAPVMPAFAVGTPGEYDWISVVAENAEAAWDFWCDEHDYEGEERAFRPEYVTRVEKWDGKDPDKIRPADWLSANLGHCCERCGYETHPESGARVVAGDVVCEECLTLPDQVESDPEEVVDELANRIADDGEGETRDWLETKGWLDRIPVELWNRAVAEVEASA